MRKSVIHKLPEGPDVHKSALQSLKVFRTEFITSAISTALSWRVVHSMLPKKYAALPRLNFQALELFPFSVTKGKAVITLSAGTWRGPGICLHARLAFPLGDSTRGNQARFLDSRNCAIRTLEPPPLGFRVMNIVQIASYEIVYYAGWWLLFVPTAYCSTRYLGWAGVFVDAAVLSLLIIFIDVHWIIDDMRNRPENERDADFVFWFGVLCRIVLFNTLLLPVFATGWRIRERRSRAIATKIA